MKVVIDISKNKYKEICELRSVWEIEPKDIIYLAIADGKPLEKELEDIKVEIKQIIVNGQVDEHISFIRTGEQVKTMVLDIIDKHCGKE